MPLFIWRLLSNQIPTKNSLVRSGIIDSLLSSSVGGKDDIVYSLFFL